MTDTLIRTTPGRGFGTVLVLAGGLLVGACSSGGGATDASVGSGSHPRLQRFEYGRLVDVYGLRQTSQGSIPDLFQRDVLVGPDIQDERGPGDTRPDPEIRYDFTGSDPDTLQPRLLIPRTIGSADFVELFDALDDRVREITPQVFGQLGANQSFTVVPRNGAFRLRFSAPLGVDEDFFVERNPQGQVVGIRNAEAVQLLEIAGDPTTASSFRPLPIRIVVGGDTLILDPVLLGSEGLQYQTRNNAAGLPESPNSTGANIRLAVALEGPLSIPSLRGDPSGRLTGINNSGRQSIVRDVRSGNVDDSTADISRGFVRDPEPPRLVGEILMYLERVNPVNQLTQEVTIFKNGVVHEIDRGDVFRFVSDNSGVPFGTAEVVVDPEDDRGMPEVQHVRARIRMVPDLENIDPSNRPGFPATPTELEDWLVQNAPKAILVCEFQAGISVEINGQKQLVGADQLRNFITFSPAPQPHADGTPSPPNENVSPFAGAVVRFTKPIDLSTARWADTMFFGTRNLLDQDAIDEFVSTRPWQRPGGGAAGVGMDPGSFDLAKFRTPHLIGARIIDEDGSQTSLRLQPLLGFYLDQAMRQDGNRPYYLHVVGGLDGIRDLAGNAIDLQTNDPTRAGGVVIPFTLDVRTGGGGPNFEDNLAVSIVRRFASRDEDPQPSYYLPEEVQGRSDEIPNARAYALQDLFGAYVLVEEQLTGRPTTRTRKIADDLNQAPVQPQTSIFRWCPWTVLGEEQTASNTSTTPFGQGIQNPLNPYGCRLQTVWREIDLSLSRVDPFDFNLDVERMYWAPLASGSITFDEFDSLVMFLGHSERRPEPCVGNFSALASLPDSGLGTRFDDNFVRNIVANAGGVGSRPEPHSAYVESPAGMRVDSALAVREPNLVNRFLPLPEMRKPYFVYRDETVMEQGCVSNVGTDSVSGAPPMDPYILSPWNNGIGRRAVQLPDPATGESGVTLMNGFWNNARNFQLRNAQTPEQYTEGLVGNVALPLLADFWTLCDSPNLPAGNGYVAFGSNGWQISLTVQSGFQPNFRVLSAGHPQFTNAPELCMSPGHPNWSTASGGWTPGPPVGTGAQTRNGDNTFYWIMIDFLKRSTVVTNGFVDLYNPHRVPNAFPDSRLGPFFTNPTSGAVQLPLDMAPVFAFELDPPNSTGGTSVVPQFRAASIVDPTAWYWNEWVSEAATLYTVPQTTPPTPRSVLVDQLRPDAVNFPLDPFKAGDAHIRKFDDRPLPGSSSARNWWSYLYNHTVTTYVQDPNTLMDPTYLSGFAGPNEGFTPRDVRYVNWRFLMTNNVDASPPVTPSIETFALSYRFQRVR